MLRLCSSRPRPARTFDKLYSTLELVAKERRKRVATGAMNRFLAKVDFERASVPMSKRVRILYMTQAAVSPPTFILFTDRAVKLHFSYQRFLENQIREAFGFVGSPIWIKTRARNEPPTDKRLATRTAAPPPDPASTP